MSMDYKFSLALLPFLLAILCCKSVTNVEVEQNASLPKDDRPNIILIIADDHGTDALGCYGNPIIKTPNMDQLAADGIRFTNAFCTTSSCSPSRSVILSGLHNHANGMYGLQHTFHHFQSHDHIKGLPVFLNEAGYRTARVGKFHIAPEEVYHFETILSAGTANDMKAISRSPIEMADLSRPIIEAKDKRPFFLFFASDDPHRGLPFESHPDPNPFGNKPGGYPGTTPSIYDPSQVEVPSFLPDNEFSRKEIAQYYQSISRLDQGVGHLISHLKAAGQYDNSLIIYMSDNGMAFPGAKTTLYDPGMKLPLIIKLPNTKNKASVADALVSWTDITPTILDFANVSFSGNFQGSSLRPILDNPQHIGPEFIYASHTFHEVDMHYPMRVIRSKDFKLIHNLKPEQNYPFAYDLMVSSTWLSVQESAKSVYGKREINSFIRRPEYELYDLQKDPDEIINLVNNPTYENLFAELKDQLHSFQMETMDPWTYDFSGMARWKTYDWPR